MTYDAYPGFPFHDPLREGSGHDLAALRVALKPRPLEP